MQLEMHPSNLLDKYMCGYTERVSAKSAMRFASIKFGDKRPLVSD